MEIRSNQSDVHQDLIELAHQFRIDFRSQLSKDLLILLVEFLNAQLKFNPKEFGNAKSDTTGNTLCTLLEKRGYINSMENITTKFRDLMSKVNEDGNRFALLRNLNAWLEHWIAKPGFQSQNQSEMAANVESRLFVLMQKNLKQANENLRGFIHPLCSDRIDEKVENHKLVLEKVLEFLNDKNPQKKVLLILGNAGSGKSSCCQMILRLLWARFNSTEIGEGEIPLFASLPTIPNPSEKVVSETLGRAGIHNPDYQTWLQENRIVHFILDGYDELFGQVNLFSQSTLESFNGKIIISCRNESLPDLKILSPKNCEVSKLYLASFTETQSIEYVTNQTNNVLLVDKFEKIVESIPSMKDFIQIPFHLKIITEILPEITKKLNENNSTLNRYEIYELFIRTRINQAIENRVGPSTSSEINLTRKQLPDAVIQQCIEWSIQMRNQQSTSLSFDASKSKIDKNLQALAGLETKEQILRWLSPLLLEENGNIVNCRFIHATIGEFFLAFQFNQISSSCKSTNQLKTEIQKHPIFSRLLGISSWQFISDLVNSIENLKKSIWDLIELSKESKEFSIVAANCASIWNICEFSFSKKDLRNIKIPGAYLNRSNFFRTDLSDSNLKGCQLKDAILIDANFEGADMNDVLFGEFSIWKFEYKLTSVILHQNYCITYSFHKGLEIWDYSARKLKFAVSDSQLLPLFILKKSEILVAKSFKEKNIQFWELKTGNLISKMNVDGNKGWISPDEQLMLIERINGNQSTSIIELIDLNGFKEFKSIWTKEIATVERYSWHSVQFSHHNQFLIVDGGKKCTVLNSLTSELIESFDGVKKFFVSEDGHELVIFTPHNVFSWNFNSKSTSKSIPAFPIDFHKAFKIPNRNEIIIFSDDICYFFDLFPLKIISQFSTRTSDIDDHHFSVDGSLLVTFFRQSGLFCLIDLNERKIVHYLHETVNTHNPNILDVTYESITILEIDIIRIFRWKIEDIDLHRQINVGILRNDLYLMEEQNQLLKFDRTHCTIWDLKTKRISYPKRPPTWNICRCGLFFALKLDNRISIGKFVETNFEEVKSISFSNVERIRMTSNGNQLLIIFYPTNQSTTEIWHVYESYTWKIISAFQKDVTKEEYLKQVILAKDFIIEYRGNTVSVSNFKGEQICVLLTDFIGFINQILPDFKFLLVFSEIENEYQMVDFETRKKQVFIQGSEWNSDICWSANGKYLLIVNENAELQIWDWQTRTLKKSLKMSRGDYFSICASKDCSEIFVGTLGSIWNFKIVELETEKIDLELIWVHQQSFIASNALLKGTKISPENRSILEHYGAIQETPKPEHNETQLQNNVENEVFGESSTKMKSNENDGKRKLTDDGDKNETNSKKQRTE